MPSDDDLGEVIERLHPQHEALYLAVHALVVGTMPDVRFGDRSCPPTAVR